MAREKQRLSTHLVFDLTTSSRRYDFAMAFRLAVANGPAARSTHLRSAVAVAVSCPSRKMGELFLCESTAEAEAMLFADVLEDVDAFRPQFVELRYVHEGRLRRAFPDLGLIMLDGRAELWECKPKRVDPSLVERLRALRLALLPHGVAYRVRTPTWLRRTPHLANVRELLRHCDRPLRESLAEEAASALGGVVATSLGMLRERVGLSHGEVCAAIARGLVAADVGACPLGDRTPVREAKRGARSGAYDAGRLERSRTAGDRTGGMIRGA